MSLDAKKTCKLQSYSVGEYILTCKGSVLSFSTYQCKIQNHCISSHVDVLTVRVTLDDAI